MQFVADEADRFLEEAEGAIARLRDCFDLLRRPRRNDGPARVDVAEDAGAPCGYLHIRQLDADGTQHAVGIHNQAQARRLIRELQAALPGLSKRGR